MMNTLTLNSDQLDTIIASLETLAIIDAGNGFAENAAQLRDLIAEIERQAAANG